MKKILFALCGLLLAVSLAACGAERSISMLGLTSQKEGFGNRMRMRISELFSLEWRSWESGVQRSCTKGCEHAPDTVRAGPAGREVGPKKIFIQ